MTQSVVDSQIITTSEQTGAQLWIRRLVWKMAIATLLLMAIGSATRVMNAGLACPDWPLCYGQLVPTEQMNLQVFLEWFHRLDASLIGISAMALTGLSWWYRKELPHWLPLAATFALGLIVFQGILGALTVTQLLRFDIVTAHLATALLFFSTLIVIATNLLPRENIGLVKIANVTKLSWLSLILVYFQCLLGGLVASRWSLHQCFGQSQLCLVMNSHILGVFPPTIATLTLVWFARRTNNLPSGLKILANVVLILIILQISLGVATFKLHLQVEPLTVAHHTVGACLLGTLVAFTVLAQRISASNKLHKA